MSSARHKSGMVMRLLAIAIAIVLLVTTTCSDSTEPDEELPPEPVVMTGKIDLSPIPDISPQDMTIYFGARQAQPDTLGSFGIQGNGGTPGLAMAVDGNPDRPIIFGVVPNPRQGQSITLNLHTTALSMVFMTPYVITNDPDDASTTLAQIEALPEFADFENHLTQRMSNGADALLAEDADTDSLFTRVVSAYIMAHIPDVPDTPEGSAPELDDHIIIDPSYERGGLKVEHLKGDNFKIINSLGRWGYTITPNREFFVSPLGDLIDILKGDAPFAPSQTPFNLHVELGADSQEVSVYGYGWSSEADNSWDALNREEQEWARLGGLWTMTVEFIPAALSVILNVRTQFRGKEVPAADVVDFMSDFTSGQETFGKLGERVSEGDALGVAWLVFKAFIGKLANDEKFQARTAALMGFAISESVAKNLIAFVAPPIKLINSIDAAVTVGKTVLGFRNGRFKTTFMIWREATDPNDFGNILGSVHDQTLGTAIEGATVLLKGDDNNPLKPSHEQVTDNNGAYYFENITVGDKTIRASKQGYYSSSVVVNVVGNATVNAPEIKLTKEVGTVHGTIANRIFKMHGLPDTRFKGRLTMRVRGVGEDFKPYERDVDDGEYIVVLPAPATYWLIITHDDYYPDSVTVDVVKDQTTEAREITMWPSGKMAGKIEYDLNNDGNFEQETSFEAVTAAATRVEEGGMRGMCPDGQDSNPRIEIQAGSYVPIHSIMLRIDVNAVTGPGVYNLGGYHHVGCPGFSVPQGIFYSTDYLQCGPTGGPIFYFRSDPDWAPCNCDIPDAGRIIFDEFGTELTDVIQGTIFSGTLPGSHTPCLCRNCRDTDGDGNNDKCDVDCMRARLQIDFRVLAGSIFPYQ
jgi:hypothetical protein